jgi:BASS family bile acid:Na+ symporter
MDVLSTLVSVAGLVFVVASMLAMGLSLTVSQIVAPLRNTRLVVLALIINFAFVPFVAWAIQAVMGLDQDIYTGLLLMATAAGAPFLPKLAQVAKGSAAFSVGLMVLLMVVTIVYMPVVLPLLLPDVSINPWDIAKSLIFLMLLPLAALQT